MASRGSSPLARGLLELSVTSRWNPGIIPARAGFTMTTVATPPVAADHPRSRGVYRRWPDPGDAGAGSSPLARGLPMQRKHLWIPRRIIPARAGFTAHLPHLLARRKDHPRSRGVYPRRAWTRSAPAGSSPLARGLPFGTAGGAEHERIITARAGFTIGPMGPWSAAKDHPRSRGVYSAGGSSPW